MLPKKLKLDLRDCGRIIAVSDIHGNLPYLKGVLQKSGFCKDDTLIILGDFTEKGEGGLRTLRYIMELSKTHRVYTLCGNHDIWALLFDGELEARDEGILDYMTRKPECLAREMCAEIGYPFSPDSDFDDIRDTLLERFAEEFDFLRAMPTLLETEHYVFVHGGIPDDEDDGYSYLKCDDFLHTSRKFDKWVIVGHWPVMLYHENIVDANPVFDYDKKIISIDGGCVLKDDGQLNALVIPHDGSEDFSVISYDRFPAARVKSSQEGGKRSYYIRWGDNTVRVLRRGKEFCLCRHERTGYEMEILTKYIYGNGEIAKVNDCTDYILPLKAGDEVSIVEKTSRGYFVKHKGISGWYYGEI